MYLTTKYNHSMIQTYNFAWSGSPVPGMVGQIEDAFVPLYTGGAKFDPKWAPSTTLFAMFCGINDLNHWDSGDTYRDNVFKQYTGAIETVSGKMCCRLTTDDADIWISSIQRALETSSYTQCPHLTSPRSSGHTIFRRGQQLTTTMGASNKCWRIFRPNTGMPTSGRSTCTQSSARS